MDTPRAPEDAGPAGLTIAFRDHLIESKAFKTLFDNGIALIEETAAYLDSEGREGSKTLANGPKLTYASISMKLTTRLMSIASWLLVQRAVHEGEMTLEQGEAERRKITLGAPLEGVKASDGMPIGLIKLVAKAQALQIRVERMEAALSGSTTEEDAPADNPVHGQLGLLSEAFN